MTDELSSRVVRTRLGPVEVATAGESGPVVLAVHGTPGDWRQARALAADLRADHRVVLPSRPGYGRTPLRVGRTPGEQADAYVALLDALDLGRDRDRAVVVGISGGGPSSYAFAARHPQRCAGLVLCCAVADGLLTPPPAMRALAAVPGLWRAAATVGRARLRRRTDDDAMLAELRRGLSPAEAAQLDTDARLRADLLAFGADRAAALRGTGLRNDTRQFLAGARGRSPAVPSPRVPVHVLHGDADTVVPVAHARHHGGAVADAIVEILPGQGHALPLTTRDRLAEVVRSMCATPAPTATAAPRRPAAARSRSRG
jgi:pimeloyl-ACP methyl ester carboxylesterase